LSSTKEKKGKKWLIMRGKKVIERRKEVTSSTLAKKVWPHAPGRGEGEESVAKNLHLQRREEKKGRIPPVQERNTGSA